MDNNKEKRPLVSVVVPIYKVEKYLRQCVDSILAQTLTDIEVILVDDGSPDRCPVMVDEYAALDGRVVAIHQENRGYGHAVNRGVEEARGEYIGIVEPDDWIDRTMYASLYQKAGETDADLVKCAFYWCQTVGGLRLRLDKHALEALQSAPKGAFTIHDHPQILIYHPSVWAALYRASFLKTVKMVETRNASYQDVPFIMEVLCRAKRIAVIPRCLVFYRSDEGQGSSSKQRDERLIMLPTQSIAAWEILIRHGCSEKLKEEFFAHVVRSNHSFFYAIDFRFKRRFFEKLRVLFRPLENDAAFAYKYFTSGHKKFVVNVIKNRFYPSMNLFARTRKYLFSLRIKKKYVRLQLFGFAFSLGAAPSMSALLAIGFMKNRPLFPSTFKHGTTKNETGENPPVFSGTVFRGYRVRMLNDGTDYLKIVEDYLDGRIVAEAIAPGKNVYKVIRDGRAYVLSIKRHRKRILSHRLVRAVTRRYIYSRMLEKVANAIHLGCRATPRLFFVAEKGSWQTPFDAILLQEYVPGRPLNRSSDITSHLASVRKSVAELHDYNLSSRDLHPGNWVFNGKRIIIIDFWPKIPGGHINRVKDYLRIRNNYGIKMPRRGWIDNILYLWYLFIMRIYYKTKPRRNRKRKPV